MATTMKKYRPANGTEGIWFHSKWCDRCYKETLYHAGKGKPCEILMRTMEFSKKDPQYPAEWTYNPEGHPICTAFSKTKPPSTIKPKVYRPPKGQLGLFK